MSVGSFALGSRRKKRFSTKNERRESLTFLLYISPWLIGFALFTIVPMVSSFIYSFQNINVLELDEGGTWVGFDNYVRVFQDEFFISSIGNTFLYAILKTVISLFLSLLLALLFNSKFWGNKAVRVLTYLPAVIPSVASIFVWSSIFSKDVGLLNMFLNFFGIPSINWQDGGFRLASVMLMGIWTSLGPNTLVILAALQSISTEVLESADVEGAGKIRKLLHITIPGIMPTLFFMSITGIIGGLQAYAEMQLLFGIPTTDTITMAWNVVLRAFDVDSPTKTMGYACAMAWLLFVIILVFTAIYFWLSKQFGAYGGNGDE